MSAEDRAAEYAALFTRVGDRWRTCVPSDGIAHQTRDEMRLGHEYVVRIARRRGDRVWKVVIP